MNKKIPLDFIMDKLLESVDKQVSLACSVSSLIDFDQNLFQQFVQKKILYGVLIVFQGKSICTRAKLRKNSLF